jgi:hypothetical protein
MADESKIMDDP